MDAKPDDLLVVHLKGLLTIEVVNIRIRTEYSIPRYSPVTQWSNCSIFALVSCSVGTFVLEALLLADGSHGV